MLQRAKRRAAIKRLPFNLELSDIVIPEFCPVLGIRMAIAGGELDTAVFGGQPNSPSIDRIVPALGYVKNNIAVISWRANQLKNNATLEELEAIVQWLKRLQQRTE